MDENELLRACVRALRYATNVGRAEGVFFDDDNDLPFIINAVAKARGLPLIADGVTEESPGYALSVALDGTIEACKDLM